MNKRVIVVLVCTLLALVAATLYVPRDKVETNSWSSAAGGFSSATKVLPIEFYAWIWRYRGPAYSPGSMWHSTIATYPVAWRYVILEQSLILLVGGGLLTFLIRRDRRRRADGASAA